MVFRFSPSSLVGSEAAGVTRSAIDDCKIDNCDWRSILTQ